MEIEFRRLTDPTAKPAPGDIEIRPLAAPDDERQAMASLVLERGLDALACGAGAPQRIIVRLDPTFDDLLAATIVQRQIDGRPIPEGLKAFAKYAALAREGLKAGDVPLDVSPESIFQAIRNDSGANLAVPETARRFVSNWSRMADVLMKAAADGLDPFTASPFATGPEFARERTFLAGDHTVYRQDVERGERWFIRLPGGVPAGSGLLLRQPKSLLFKHWSRRDADAPVGGAYLFLAVDWGKANWIFSTDPLQHLSIEPLAGLLQAAECAANPDAAGDPWYDGRRHDHTLVAAPHRGTRLPDATVLRIVKKWTSARPPRKAMSRRRALAYASFPLVIGAGAWPVIHAFFPRPPDLRREHPQPRHDTETDDGPIDPTRSRLFVIAAGVSQYQDTDYNLPCPQGDVDALAEVFRQQKEAGGLFHDIVITCLKNEQATKNGILTALRDLRARKNDLALILLSGHGTISSSGRFFFLPHDFDKHKLEAATAASWDDLTEFLLAQPCMVVVVMDACHAAQVTRNLKRGMTPLEDLEDEIHQKVETFKNADRGIVVMAASTSKQAALENKNAWGHSALMVALLEGLTGRRQEIVVQCPGDPRRDEKLPLPHERQHDAPVIDLKSLSDYVSDRVDQITCGKQSVLTKDSGGDIDFKKIPIAVLPRANRTTAQ